MRVDVLVQEEGVSAGWDAVGPEQGAKVAAGWASTLTQHSGHLGRHVRSP